MRSANFQYESVQRLKSFGNFSSSQGYSRVFKKTRRKGLENIDPHPLQ